MKLTKAAVGRIEVAARKAERSKQKHAKFMARTLSIYRGQQARLRKLSGQDDAMLPFTLEEFRAWFQAGLDAGCGYTGERLTIKSAAADHDVPLKRGGTWSLSNLVLCRASCNFGKGELTGAEYQWLMSAASQNLAKEAFTDFKRRLAAGGKLLRMRF